MKFFIDTANVDEIREAASLGILDGVTTNPSLVAKEGKDFHAVLREIVSIVNGPISAEVTATDREEMLDRVTRAGRIHPNIVIKVPLTKEGLQACKAFRNEGIKVNVTLCFSPSQALLAAKAGCDLHQPVHRPARRHLARRHGVDPPDPGDLRQLRLRDRDPRRLDPPPACTSSSAALAGADVATMPFKVVNAADQAPADRHRSGEVPRRLEKAKQRS